MTTRPNWDTFYCQECGHKFRSVKAAERASFGPEGCPECGGSDIDLGAPAENDKARAEATAAALGSAS